MTAATPPSDSKPSAQDVQGLRDDIQGLRRDLYGEGERDGGIIGFLRSGYRGNRWRIRLLIVSLIVELVLTGLFLVTAAGQNSACNRANQQRLTNKTLWHHVLDLSPPRTPQQAQINSQFRIYVDKEYTPLNCSFWSTL